MITDYIIISGSLLVALLISFVTSYFDLVRILVPERAENPLPENPGDPIYFQFSTYRRLKDYTLYKPKFLLTLIIFSLLTLISKTLFNSGHSWDFIIYTSGCGMMVLLLIITLRSTLLIAIFMALPAVAVSHFITKDPFWISLAAGILIGAMAGMSLSKSYFTLRCNSTLRMEFDKDKSKWNMAYHKSFAILLRLVPWLIFYQLITYLWPAISPVTVVTKIHIGWLAWLAAPIMLILAINIALYTLPLFREILTNTNIEASAEFTKEVRELEKKAANRQKSAMDLLEADRKARRLTLSNFIQYIICEITKANYTENEVVNDYLGKKWQWLAFQSEQILWLLAMVIALILRITGECLSLAEAGNLTSFTGKHHVEIHWYIQVAAAVTFWTNAMFLIGMASFLESDDEENEGEEKIEPVQKNLEIFWESKLDADLRVICAMQGSEAILLREGEPLPEQEPDPEQNKEHDNTPKQDEQG